MRGLQEERQEEQSRAAQSSRVDVRRCEALYLSVHPPILLALQRSEYCELPHARTLLRDERTAGAVSASQRSVVDWRLNVRAHTGDTARIRIRMLTLERANSSRGEESRAERQACGWWEDAPCVSCHRGQVDGDCSDSVSLCPIVHNS